MQLSKFKIQLDNNQDHILYITVDGISLQFKKDSEGIDINVFDDKSGDEIKSIAIDEDTLYPGKKYYYNVQRLIGLINPSIEVSSEFLDAAFYDELTVAMAVESFFCDASFEVDLLSPLKGLLPTSLPDAVKTFTSPYIAINEEQFNRLRASYPESDYFITPGGLVVSYAKATVTNSSTGYGLFPVNEINQEHILSLNNITSKLTDLEGFQPLSEILKIKLMGEKNA